jgi:hypothetical protein
LLAFQVQATLLGVAALLSALGGIASTWIGAKRARREEREKAEQECRDRLRDTRAEAERLALELHELRMKDIREG